MPHFVDDLAPYIERKLFTVNTGHAATAYFGAIAGVETISGALSDDRHRARVSAQRSRRPLRSWPPSTDSTPPISESYRETILRRFRNPALPDTVWRVGRQPLRKLSRHERFVGPAAEAAERGLSVDALVGAMGAALAFDDAEDAQSVDLQRMLREQDAASVTSSVTGLEPGHPLFSRVEADRGGPAGGARVTWRGDGRRSPVASAQPGDADAGIPDAGIRAQIIDALEPFLLGS